MGTDSSATSLFLKGHITVIRKNVTKWLYISHVTAELFIDQYSPHFLFQKSICYSENIDYIIGTIRLQSFSVI